MVATDDTLLESTLPGQCRGQRHRTAGILSAQRHGASISSAACVVKKGTTLPKTVFSVLDRLFGDVDAYCAAPSVRGSDGLGDEELLTATNTALAALAKII